MALSNGQKMVLGWKHTSFMSPQTGMNQPWHQLALDLGNKLAILTVRPEQADMLDDLSPGQILEPDTGFITDKYFIFL